VQNVCGWLVACQNWISEQKGYVTSTVGISLLFGPHWWAKLTYFQIFKSDKINVFLQDLTSTLNLLHLKAWV